MIIYDKWVERIEKTIHIIPGWPPYKKHGNHRKSDKVIYENSKVIESAIEVYGDMQVMKRP